MNTEFNPFKNVNLHQTTEGSIRSFAVGTPLVEKPAKVDQTDFNLNNLFTSDDTQTLDGEGNTHPGHNKKPGLSRNEDSALKLLEENFTTFDTDGNGHLTADEIRRALASHFAPSLVNTIVENLLVLQKANGHGNDAPDENGSQSYQNLTLNDILYIRQQLAAGETLTDVAYEAAEDDDVVFEPPSVTPSEPSDSGNPESDDIPPPSSATPRISGGN